MTEHFPPRTSKRAPIETRVRFRFANLDDFEERQSADLSLGGMFLKGRNPPPTGTRVDFEFVLTDEAELIRGTGEVVWSREKDEGPDQPAGMGIRFLKLSPGSRAIIFHAVDRWIQEGGEPFDVDKEAPGEAAEVPPREEPEPQVPAQATEPAVLPEKPEAASPLPSPGRPVPEPGQAVEAEPSSPEPLSELVARATGSDSPPAAPTALDPGAFEPSRDVPEDDDTGDLSSSRVGGVAYASAEKSRIRWGRLIGLAALLILVAALVNFTWLRDHDPTPSTMETTERIGSPDADEPAADPALEPDGDSPPGETPTAAVTDAASPGPETVSEPAAAAPDPPPTRPVTRLEEISWNESVEGTEVVLVGDGSFELQRWTHFHLVGPNPREVVKIQGIQGPYERSFLPVGSPELRQVRTGFHTRSEVNELHVVMDLTDSRVEATQVEATGRILRIRLSGPRS